MAEHTVLMNVVLALALGALVGTERERQPDRKYAGVRTLTLLCGAGPLAVLVAQATSSVLPVLVYLSLTAAFSLLIIHIRMKVQEEYVGFTTSTTVFLMGLVGVLVGYGHFFEAVATTLIAVFLLSEKKMVHRYTRNLEAKEISDAVKLGILAFVLYPILPAGAVDPYNVLFLRKALLFVIFILLIQFAAFVALNWFRHRLSFLAAAATGGVVSSLAVVTTMARFVKEQDLTFPAYSAAIIAAVAMLARNGFLAVSLTQEVAVFQSLLLPFGAAMIIGTVAAIVYYRRAESFSDAEFGTYSPFSFRSAFKFGVFFLAILMASELAKTYFSVAGAYGAAFLGGAGSSTAVVASAATLLASGSITPHQTAVMVVLGAVSSLLSKLVYTELGGARALTRHLLPVYVAMAVLALLLV